MNQRHPDRAIISCYVWRKLKKAIKREGDVSEVVRVAIVRELRRRGRKIPKEWAE
jgi:hypothetical protein